MKYTLRGKKAKKQELKDLIINLCDQCGAHQEKKHRGTLDEIGNIIDFKI